MSWPQFSVVIPTRNRPATLPFALRTCLEQQHPNYEVVVCDNSDSPATREVVDPFACDRLRYVKAPEPLAACDNWNLALSHTRGEYVVFIGDDDALLPHSLTQLADFVSRTKAKALTWSSVTYSWPTFVVPEEANVLVVPLSREVESVEGKSRLRDVMARRVGLDSMPYHGAVHRDVLARIRRPDGTVFSGLYYDSVVCVGLAYAVGTYTAISVPLSVSGHSGAGNHAGFRMKCGDHPSYVDSQMLNEIAGHRLHPWVPDLHCNSSVMADAFLKAKANLFPDDDDLVLDRKLMATWQLSEMPYTDPDQRRRAIGKIRDSLKDSGELVAWFDSLDHASFPPVPPSMLPRGGLGFRGNSLVLDASLFGVHDVAAAAKLCGDILRYPAHEVPLDLPCPYKRAHLQFQDFNERLNRLHAEYVRVAEDGRLRNVPRRVFRKFMSMVLPRARSA